MKAVIMAGGEGTRLRPQTSNLPKPMLPLVGRPMMEHIVSLLRRHGITDIVVTVAFLPNAIRSYFGDGSELGVSMSYATEESPLGTAGSVRNAMPAADRALRGHLGRRAHRHRSHVGHLVPREEPGAGHHRAQRGREPARVRHRHHREKTGPSSASWRSPGGDRSSATPSTRGSTCSSPRSSTASPTARRSTSRARSSPRCSRPVSPSTATWRTATGRTSGRRPPT